LIGASVVVGLMQQSLDLVLQLLFQLVVEQAALALDLAGRQVVDRSAAADSVAW
jgi:hypothetical protein